MAKKNEEITVEFLVKESKAFVEFLKKFTNVDQSVLLEFSNNDEGKRICIKTATASGTCAKIGYVPFTEIFKDSDKIPESLKLGIFNFDKFVKVISLAKDNDIKFKVKYDIDSKTKECVAKTTELTNVGDGFELYIVNAPKTLFEAFDNKKEERLFNTDDVAFNFILTREFFAKFNSYIALDANDSFEMSIKNNKLLFTGKTQKIPFPDEVEIEDSAVVASTKKEYLKFLDDEVYRVYVKNASVLFESNDSDIKLILANIEDDADVSDEEDDDIFDDDIFDDDEEVSNDVDSEDEEDDIDI